MLICVGFIAERGLLADEKLLERLDADLTQRSILICFLSDPLQDPDQCQNSIANDTIEWITAQNGFN